MQSPLVSVPCPAPSADAIRSDGACLRRAVAHIGHPTTTTVTTTATATAIVITAIGIGICIIGIIGIVFCGRPKGCSTRAPVTGPGRFPGSLAPCACPLKPPRFRVLDRAGTGAVARSATLHEELGQVQVAAPPP